MWDMCYLGVVILAEVGAGAVTMTVVVVAAKVLRNCNQNSRSCSPAQVSRMCSRMLPSHRNSSYQHK